MSQRPDAPAFFLPPPATVLDAIILQLANAAAHDTNNVAMEWREELALGAAALAGFRVSALIHHRLDLVDSVLSVIGDLQRDGRLSPTVRLIEDLWGPGSFARLLRPEHLLSRQHIAPARFAS